MNSKVEIRRAFPEDAPFIAESVLSAMGYDRDVPVSLGIGENNSQTRSYEDVRLALEEIAARPDTLYSYRNTHIATYDGEVAGALVGYDGAGYREMASLTFGLVAEKLGVEPFNPGEETGEGEYYLDSLHVSPEYRGHAIGAILMRNELDVAEALGFRRVSLIVDKEKPWLHRIYSRLGFEAAGDVLFFGETYLRMTQVI
ncbi:MAG: GNAT family N-acetyltransferase [Candidatus Cryptobacteroides sp.]